MKSKIKRVLKILGVFRNETDKKESEASLLTIDDPSPFQLMDDDGHFTIMVALENEELFNKYYPFFEKHEYEGNGYCWEGHIIQILEKEDKELLKHIELDPEAGSFFVYADSKKTQIMFVNLLSPIFSNLDKLETYVKIANRERIDD